MILKFLTIKENDSGQRLDKFMLKSFKKLSKSMLYNAIRKKDIKLNGKRCQGNEILCENDTLRICLPDDVAEQTKKTFHSSVKPNIIYEDDNIILINKPAGLDVQPSGENSDSALAQLHSYLKFDESDDYSFSPAFCNRLDRNTEGIIIAAKNSRSLREINQCIRENKIHKEYITVVSGKLDKKHNIVKKYHCQTENNTVKISDKALDGYKETLTEYFVLSEKNNLSLLRINLITGKKHQIRAVLASFGHPVVGDSKYGNTKINFEYNAKYQVLRAFKITFEPDSDMLINYLKDKSFEIDISDIKQKFSF